MFFSGHVYVHRPKKGVSVITDWPVSYVAKIMTRLQHWCAFFPSSCAPDPHCAGLSLQRGLLNGRAARGLISQVASIWPGLFAPEEDMAVERKSMGNHLSGTLATSALGKEPDRAEEEEGKPLQRGLFVAERWRVKRMVNCGHTAASAHAGGIKRGSG